MRGWPISVLRRRPKAQNLKVFRRQTSMSLTRWKAWRIGDAAVDQALPGPPLHHHQPRGIPGRTHAINRQCGDAVLIAGEIEGYWIGSTQLTFEGVTCNICVFIDA